MSCLLSQRSLCLEVPINHSSIRQFLEKKDAEFHMDLHPLWGIKCCAIWKAGEAMQQQQAAAAAAFLSRLSGGNCWVVKRAFVAADGAGRAYQQKITERKNNQLLLCYLKRKSCPTTGESEWRWNQPKRRLFTSLCLCLEWEMSTGTQKEDGKKRRKGENQLRSPLLIPQTSDNKSLCRHCNWLTVTW